MCVRVYMDVHITHAHVKASGGLVSSFVILYIIFDTGSLTKAGVCCFS